MFLDIAETMDAWRLFPRLFLCIFYIILVDVHYWYLFLETRGPYELGYVTAVWGAVAAVTKFYVDSGRNWTPKQENSFDFPPYRPPMENPFPDQDHNRRGPLC